MFIYQYIVPGNADARRTDTDFATSTDEDAFSIALDTEPNDSVLLPNGNVVIVLAGDTQIEAKVYDSDLSVIASTTFDTDNLGLPIVTSYPAGGDGYFAIALTDDDDFIAVKIFD